VARFRICVPLQCARVDELGRIDWPARDHVDVVGAAALLGEDARWDERRGQAQRLQRNVGTCLIEASRHLADRFNRQGSVEDDDPFRLLGRRWLRADPYPQ
jgi:hypothetical protein